MDHRRNAWTYMRSRRQLSTRNTTQTTNKQTGIDTSTVVRKQTKTHNTTDAITANIYDEGLDEFNASE